MEDVNVESIVFVMAHFYPAKKLIGESSMGIRGSVVILQTFRFRKISAKVLALLLCVGLIGCAAPNTGLFTSSVLPVAGSADYNSSGNGAFQVHEYDLVGQSTDNPNHVSFQKRVPAAVTERGVGWPFNQDENQIQATNQTLAPFGYHLAVNPSPPFSGYALYHDGNLVQRDIARFWPVSLQKTKNDIVGSDFLLSFETLDGVKLVASMDGIKPWPSQDQSVGSTPPVFYGQQIAFAESVGSEVSVYAGSNLLYNGSPSNSEVNRLQTWGDNHWALELKDDVIVDGQDLNQVNGYDRVFGWQLIDGQPFYFFERGGLVHFSYAGRNLPYTYDQVVHGNTGSLAIFNPGEEGNIAWFYALRDGVWYYVEVGVFG